MNRNILHLNSLQKGFSSFGFMSKAFAVLVLITGFFLTAQNAFATIQYESFDVSSNPINAYYGLTVSTGGGAHPSNDNAFTLRSVQFYLRSGNGSTATGTFRLKATTDGGASYCFSDVLDATDYEDSTALHWISFLPSAECDILATDEISMNSDTLSGVPDLAMGGNSGLGAVFIRFHDTEGVDEVGITSGYPNNETGVDYYTTFSGIYSNDGLYTSVILGYFEGESGVPTSNPLYLVVCDLAVFGVDIPYSCSVSLKANTTYTYNVGLWDSDNTLGLDFPDDLLVDSLGEYTFTTGSTYTPGTPPTSSECEGFDVGCYLESAIGWAFSVSPSTLESFTNLSLDDKFPFSYLYDVPDLFDSLSGSTAPSLSLDIDIGSDSVSVFSATTFSSVPFASTIRTYFTWIIYFFMVYAVYRRVITHFDNHTLH